MARYENRLTTLQSRTILHCVRVYDKSLQSRYDIEKAAREIVETLVTLFPVQFPIDNNAAKQDNPYYAYLAFALSACGKEGVKRGVLNVLAYIAMLAELKEEHESTIKDFGAFGDLYEILIRCALMRKLSLVRWSALSVKEINDSDITSKKYGVLEIGHNGKTFSFGTLFDYMEGNYTGVIYGVFSDEDKTAVYQYCKEKQYDKAIDYVTSYSALWKDKYDFQNTMDNLTRGKGITVKGGNVQVVYNSGKYDAFVSALDNGIIKSLKETLSE